MAELKDFQFEDVKLTDYIDESLIKLLNRDNASRISFRCSGNFPSPVTEELIGMTCYRVDLKAEYRLVSVVPDPTWLLISNEAGTATNKEEVAANYQKKNANLTSMSNLKGSKDTLPYFTDTDTLSLTALTEFSRNLLSKLTKEEVRTLLGLGRAATLDIPIKGSYIEDNSIKLNQIDTSSMGPLLPSTGTCWLTLAPSAPEGWVMADDGTIGSTSSGASHASEATKDLFYMLWSLPATPIYTATGNLREKGSTADIDWYANARLGLPRTLGRVLGVAGQGEGLTPRFNGETVGEEKHTMTVEELATHNHSYTAPSHHGKHGHYSSRCNWWSDGDSGGVKATGVMTDTGESQPFNVMQPTSFMNLIIKL